MMKIPDFNEALNILNDKGKMDKIREELLSKTNEEQMNILFKHLDKLPMFDMDKTEDVDNVMKSMNAFGEIIAHFQS